jgi:hypothetical protein
MDDGWHKVGGRWQLHKAGSVLGWATKNSSGLWIWHVPSLAPGYTWSKKQPVSSLDEAGVWIRWAWGPQGGPQ